MKKLILFLFLSLAFTACSTTPKIPRTILKVELERMCTEGGKGACLALGEKVELTPTPNLAILQGPSSNKYARFVVQTPKNKELFYFIRPMVDSGNPDSGPIQIIPKKFNADSTRWNLDHLETFDVKSGFIYQLFVLDTRGQLEDMREFVAPDLDKKRPKIAMMSCMDDKLVSEQKAMWPLVTQNQPDLIYMIGDNVYADRNLDHAGDPTPQDLWKRYSQSRNQLQIFREYRLTPIIAVWDDHDYGKNDGDRTFPHKEIARTAFFAHFPQKTPAHLFERGPGVSSWLTAFKIGFAFLDDRFDRSPNGLDSVEQTHFGIDQENWLREKMGQHKGPVVLISGDQFFGGYHSFESYQGNHPKKFEAHLNELKRHKYPIIFFSGDRHLAEIIDIPKKELGYRTFEFTSSGIHAKVFPDAFQRNPNPKKIAGVAGQYNFMMLEFLKNGPHLLEINAKSIGEQGKVQFTKKLKVQK